MLMKCREITMLDGSFVTYIAWAFEVGDKGTPHMQGYMETSKEVRFTQVFKLFGFNFHLERRKASSGEEAQDYFEHPENHNKPPHAGFEFYGVMSKNRKGKRNDLLELKASLDAGETLAEVADKHFGCFVRYEKSIRSYKRLKASPRDFVPEVIVLWGDTGTGKTRKAFESGPAPYFHPGGSWFDGFEGQEVAIFDDFSGSCFPIAYLLKLLDRYPMQVPIKGGFVEWNPRKIFITSNMNPKDWYSKALPEHVLALERRFTKVEHFLDFTRERIPEKTKEGFKQLAEMNAGGQGWKFYDCSDNIFN